MFFCVCSFSDMRSFLVDAFTAVHCLQYYWTAHLQLQQGTNEADPQKKPAQLIISNAVHAAPACLFT